MVFNGESKFAIALTHTKRQPPRSAAHRVRASQFKSQSYMQVYYKSNGKWDHLLHIVEASVAHMCMYIDDV